jgi:hypothetical protein
MENIRPPQVEGRAFSTERQGSGAPTPVGREAGPGGRGESLSRAGRGELNLDLSDAFTPHTRGECNPSDDLRARKSLERSGRYLIAPSGCEGHRGFAPVGVTVQLTAVEGPVSDLLAVLLDGRDSEEGLIPGGYGEDTATLGIEGDALAAPSVQVSAAVVLNKG